MNIITRTQIMERASVFLQACYIHLRVRNEQMCYSLRMDFMYNSDRNGTQYTCQLHWPEGSREFMIPSPEPLNEYSDEKTVREVFWSGLQLHMSQLFEDGFLLQEHDHDIALSLDTTPEFPTN